MMHRIVLTLKGLNYDYRKSLAERFTAMTGLKISEDCVEKSESRQVIFNQNDWGWLRFEPLGPNESGEMCWLAEWDVIAKGVRDRFSNKPLTEDAGK